MQEGKQEGIKYVEFYIEASGFGCVNTNGNINPKTGEKGTKDGTSNHVFSKQREGQLYISSNCIRGHLFEKDARGAMLGRKGGFQQTGKNGELVVAKRQLPEISQIYASSYLGLLRGYLLVQKDLNSLKRFSPLMMTDWKNRLGRPNKGEMMVNHLAVDDNGTRESNSLFSSETWGDTLYEGTAVISIETLQFLALDNRLGQQSVCFSQNGKKDSVKEEIDNFLTLLITNIQKIGKKNGMPQELCCEISAKYGLFIKPETLFNFPEEGILLNNAAIHALVLETVSRLKSFTITKSKGFVKTESVKTILARTFKDSKNFSTISNKEIPDYACFYKPSEGTSC